MRSLPAALLSEWHNSLDPASGDPSTSLIESPPRQCRNKHRQGRKRCTASKALLVSMESNFTILDGRVFGADLLEFFGGLVHIDFKRLQLLDTHLVLLDQLIVCLGLAIKGVFQLRFLGFLLPRIRFGRAHVA